MIKSDIKTETSNILIDFEVRERALDTTASFIVEAPAGSGKTEILSQRFLALLSTVERVPEEIIAITFTRKAASEMRTRIHTALVQAAKNVEPNSEHQQKTFALARAALQRDAKHQWQLLENPNRLRIMTIDALCARIAAQLPIISGLGGGFDIAEDSYLLYQDAAAATLKTLENEVHWSDALAEILLHVDNDQMTLQRLFVDMLSKRDQWLPLIFTENPEQQLKASLEHCIQDTLQHLKNAIPEELATRLMGILNFAVQHADLKVLENLTHLPGCQMEDLPAWQAIAELLLTQKGTWRLSLNYKQGFPTNENAKIKNTKAFFQTMKADALALIQDLSLVPGLQEKLDIIFKLPQQHLLSEQWHLLTSLVQVLPVLAAHLHLTFKNRQKIDYSEVNLRALRALGRTDDPSDIALALDSQLRHLLIDEFQDTSISQFKLLQLLTAGWQASDGRTLFLVGDPMQSIYRFRKAEVGLFLQAQRFGVGDIQLKPLRLRANFRSESGIVAWVNQTFQTIMPAENDLNSGAITYHAAVAVKSAMDTQSCIQIHGLFDKDMTAEALRVVEIIQMTRQKNSTSRIAILVQARSHLLEIIPHLKQQQIDYRAVEIETLSHRMIIQDLLTLTRALLHPGDRTAWLSVLRAPWCGLSLNDLLLLAGENDDACILDLCSNETNSKINSEKYSATNFELLSADAKARLARVLPIFKECYSQRYRQTLAVFVENTWIALGGPAVISELRDLDDATLYFEMLSTVTDAEDIVDFSILERRLNQLAASSQSQTDNPVEIMTIHKSKGLEFDSVILPGLERKTPYDPHPLLIWTERLLPDGKSELLMAPIKNQHEEPVYDYIRHLENVKAEHELTRLLYVATTRAKKELHVLANVTTAIDDEEPFKKPQSGSLLQKLWPSIYDDLRQQLGASHLNISTVNTHEDAAVSSNLSSLHRLKNTWRYPATLPCPLSVATKNSVQRRVNSYEWRTPSHKTIGTVIHDLLQQLSLSALPSDPKKFLHARQTYIEIQLKTLGTPQSNWEFAKQKITEALVNTLNDERGRWILDYQHQDAQSEYALSMTADRKVMNIILDRTFIFEGKRYIIDFKSSQAEDDGIDAFLDAEVTRYRGQLEQYAACFKKMSSLPIVLGLYFPLLKRWYAWDYS